MGNSHGEDIAEKRLVRYSDELCGDEDDYWNQCVAVSTKHLKDYELQKEIKGRLILKHGNFIGIFTQEGPVTMTMPSDHYQLTEARVQVKNMD